MDPDRGNRGQAVPTTLVWPNISGVPATEYMVLGSDHQYQLVTTPIDQNGDNDATDPGEAPLYTLNSFEQYWKTYDVVKKKLLSDLLPSCLEKDQVDDPNGSITVPTEPTSLRTRLTGSGTNEYGFHSYSKMAYAKRWNGYNADGEKKKGWETQEHWFQTVKMGSGYFDLIPTTIDPALILLDQHGWEIMRKPMPYTSEGEEAEKKLKVLASYDSPMVKEYIFWSSAKKRSGFHQYYLMDKRVGGSDFTTTSLADLTPDGSDNVRDSKGNLNDQYDTYIVRDEYALSYNPDGQVAEPFLIRQGTNLAYNNNGAATIGKTDVGPTSLYPGGVSQYIIKNITTLNSELWYVRPNADIDAEMGYTASNHNWDAKTPNAYEDAAYSKLRVASIINGASDDAVITKFGRFTFSNGFDPYNIQISSTNDSKYMTMSLTGAQIDEGAVAGSYIGSARPVTLDPKNTTPVVGTGYDNSKWNITNQTYMAVTVTDKEGNKQMQLVPRFDHALRLQNFEKLVTPTEEVEQADKLQKTYTQLYRPFVYNYRIIDNTGLESLRYQSGGELLPQTPDHFKSPLAKDFKYYKGLTYTGGAYSLTNISSKEITASMTGAGMNATVSSGNPSFVDECNPVYVRYAYDEAADAQQILLGKWLTMHLNGNDVMYNNGILQTSSYALVAIDDTDMNSQIAGLNVAGTYFFRIGNGPSYTYKKVTVTYNESTSAFEHTEPVADDEANWTASRPIIIDVDAKKWQWKFLKNPYTAPDPYAVKIFNRSKKDLPMSAATPPTGEMVTAQTDGAANKSQRFALLSHTDADGNADGYALAVAGTESYTYPFLNGSTMTTAVPAIIAEAKSSSAASGFNCTSGEFHSTDTQVLLLDDVINTFTYHVYTNGTSGASVYDGIEAISVDQSEEEARDGYDYVPTLPNEARSPLLTLDQYTYYEAKDDMGNSSKELKNLYGLYEGDVYVRYSYDPDKSEYLVPNQRNDLPTTDGKVDKGSTSNDSPLRFGDKLLYNIIWYNDEIMKSKDDGTGVL